MTNPITGMSALELAYAAKQLAANHHVLRADPIAIVGMACRFPGGADSLAGYRDLLHQGIDAVGDIPADRWDLASLYDADPKAAGKMYCRSGSYLPRIHDFDPAFFGITPREARALDPQQRLLLEVAWEAVTNSGSNPRDLYGTNAGVFMGVSTFDFAARRLASGDRAAIDPYFVSGTVLSAAAGRLSYVLGTNGPSMIVDTACSSSLVATHLACESLRRRECDTALAGGVGLVMAPEPHIAFCKAGMLAPDGRCKTFDASADGYGRGEGCGVLVLKRLSQALADGNPIWAVIRGSAVNQDGASGGLTVPSGPSQEAVIQTALNGAGLEPRHIDVIEAHGTGTSLGDPIEMGALGNVFGRGERNNPLMVGSVKTNFGHLEAAAGVAGIMKTVLAMNDAVVPQHLHFQTPNPNIDWSTLNVMVPRVRQPWPEQDGGKRAGVSSFGFAGTNAFVTLEAFSHSAAPALTTQPVPFQRKLFQPQPSQTPAGPQTTAVLPGKRLKLPGSNEVRFEADFGVGSPKFVDDHHIFGEVIVAGAAHLSFLLEAQRAAFAPDRFELVDLTLQRALSLPEDGKRTVQLVFRPKQDQFQLELLSSEADNADGAWISHVKGHLQPRREPAVPAKLPVGQWRETWLTRDPADLYGDIEAMGHHLGASFRRLKGLWIREREALSRIERHTPRDQPYWFQPGFLDSCLQYLCIEGPRLLFGDQVAQAKHNEIYIPFFLERVVLHQAPTQDGDLYCHSRLRPHQTNIEAVCGDLRICNEAGEVLLECIGLTVRRLQREAMNKVVSAGAGQHLHVLKWRKQTMPAEVQPYTEDRWLLVGPGREAASAFERFLQARGRQVQVIEDHAAAEHLLKSESGPQAVVYFARDLQNQSRAVNEPALDCAALLTLVQSLATRRNENRPRLDIVTRRTWSVTPSDELGPPDGAALWGMARVIQLEYPAFRCSLLDLDAWQAADPAWSELLHDDHEHQVAFRNGERYVARLQAQPVPPSREPGQALGGTVLITGGLGALGLATAQRLAEMGAETLVLVSRGTASEAVNERLEQIRATGTQVVPYQADISEASQVGALFQALNNRFAPLTGVVHAAGALDDGLLGTQTKQRFEAVMQPKTRGAWLLHHHTRDLPLQFFVLFSSMTALLGRRGQAAYAAANAYMTGLAHLRRAKNLPATAVHWCGWSQIGMAAELDPAVLRRLDQEGIGMIETQDGLDLFEQFCRGEADDVAVLPMDWGRYLQQYGAQVPPLFESLTPATTPIVEPVTRKGKARRQWDALGQTERASWLKEYVRKQIATVMGLDTSDAVADDARLFDLGVDSIMVIQLQEDLEQGLDIQLTPNLVFNHPTVTALTGYLLDEVLQPKAPPAPEPSPPETPATAATPEPETPVETDLNDIDSLSAGLEAKLKSLSKWIEP